MMSSTNSRNRHRIYLIEKEVKTQEACLVTDLPLINNIFRIAVIRLSDTPSHFYTDGSDTCWQPCR